jgi:hypothetical protein
VTVQHLNVQSGAQAVIGTVRTGGPAPLRVSNLLIYENLRKGETDG